jgi:hypothetical protein
MESFRINERKMTKFMPDIKPINLSKINNGFIKEWLQNHYYRLPKARFIFSFAEIIRLALIIFHEIRVIMLIFIVDDNDRRLVYFGSPFQYLGGNRFHNEFLFVLWNLDFILTHIFVFYNNTQKYKWLEIFTFLGGLTQYSSIGNIKIIYFSIFLHS